MTVQSINRAPFGNFNGVNAEHVNACLFVCLLIILFIGILFIPSSALAIKQSKGQGMQPKEEKSQSSKLWEELSDGLEYSVRILGFGAYQDPANSSQNPDNDFFQIARHTAEFNFRPDARLTFRRLDLSVKPRMNLEWKAWEDGARQGDTQWNDDWFINEWLARIRVMESLFVSYGRENLQWGPSYLLSPSNPFFVDNGRSNPKREVPGMDFARLVWIPSISWTVSFISNPDKGRQEYRFFEFDKTYALKLDYSGQEAYASMIFSHKEPDRNRLGFFGGWTATDALLLYSEGTISEGTDALYPEKANNPFGALMEAIYDQNSSLKGMVLAGGSYTLEMGSTLTVEYVYSGLGFSDDQAETYYRLRQGALDAYTDKSSIGSLSRLILSQTADPGFRFLRRNYVMLQYNHNDIKDVLNLTFRWTRNIDDDSGQFISILEYFAGDNIQFFSIGSINSGSKDSEYKNILDCQWMVGLEYTF